MQPPPPKKKKLGHVYHITQHRSPEDLYSYYSIILPHGFVENKDIVRYTFSLIYMEQVTVIRGDLFLSVIWFKPTNNCDYDATYKHVLD
jgi:hypothetical protein